MPRPSALLLRTVLLIAFAWFGLWSCRRLWRHASSRYGQLVYVYGVKWWGLGFWVTMTVIMVGQSGVSTLRDLAFRTIAMMLVNLPLGLWGGYFLGRAMAWAFGVPAQNDNGAA